MPSNEKEIELKWNLLAFNEPPKDRSRGILIFFRGHIDIAYFLLEEPEKRWTDADGNRIRFTHWMELPEAPE